jgi:hypothetical protein
LDTHAFNFSFKHFIQERILSIRQKDADDTLDNDARLARSIMMDIFRNTGTVLSVAATTPSSMERYPNDPRSFVMRMFSQEEQAAASQVLMEFVHNELPVHMVVYLYGNLEQEQPSSQQQQPQMHITTLEFLLLNIDNFTYPMRQRQAS